jgi:hypothetical protein
MDLLLKTLLCATVDGVSLFYTAKPGPACKYLTMKL